MLSAVRQVWIECCKNTEGMSWTPCRCLERLQYSSYLSTGRLQ